MHIDYRLIAGCHAGLCNRLRVMLFGRELAKQSGRRFMLFWPATSACGCSFNHLFDEPIPLASQREFGKVGATYLCRYWDGSRLPKSGKELELLTIPNQCIHALSYSWLLYPGRFPFHDLLLYRARQALGRLQPVNSIHNEIEMFKSRHFTAFTISVHIRRGDFWRLSPTGPAPLDKFIREIDKTIDEQSDSSIFIASDDGAPVNHRTGKVICEGIIEKISSRYGKRVIACRPASLIRSEPEAVRCALVDLLLVRSTDRFIGTSGSSFSELAIAGRKVPHVMVGGVCKNGNG